ELSHRVGVSLANLSVLKNNRARAVRYSTLIALCRLLDCQRGDLCTVRPRQDRARAQERPDRRTVRSDQTTRLSTESETRDARPRTDPPLARERAGGEGSIGSVGTGRTAAHMAGEGEPR